MSVKFENVLFRMFFQRDGTTQLSTAHFHPHHL